MTYAHEFNHALQDQHYRPERDRAQAPRSATIARWPCTRVIEGDAVLLQTLWAAGKPDQDDLTELSRGGAVARQPGPRCRLSCAPSCSSRMSRASISCARRTARPATTTPAVDELFKNPPESTSQILHSEKYRDHVQPVDVQLPDVATTLGPGLAAVGSGVLGELDTRVLLEQWGQRSC